MRKSFAKVLLLALLFVTFYLLRLQSSKPEFKEGQNVRVTGRISTQPSIIQDKQKLVLENLAVYIDRYPEYGYGDKISVTGKTTQGKSGWYLKNPSLIRLEENNSWLDLLRRNIDGMYKKFLPEPQASLLSGIVLGTKSGLDFEFFEALRKTGTLHVVVASGSNIALVGGGIMAGLASFIGRKKVVFLALVAIWAYVLMVGLEPPILRAGIMGTIAFVAQALGKEAFAWRALLVSAGILLLLYPNWLSDIGFQLSFAATAGILLLGQRITSTLKTHLRVPILTEEIGVVFGAQILTAPFLFAHFAQLSPTSPVVNLLVVWTVPFVMVLGVVMAMLGSIWEPLGQLAAWFAYLPLTYFVEVVRWFGH